MEGSQKTILPAAIISGAVVLSTWLLGSSIIRARGGNEEIKVTGSARKEIESDLIQWTGTVSYRSDTLNGAVTALKNGSSKLSEFLKSKGISDDEMTMGGIRTNPLYETTKNEYDGASSYRAIKGYEVSQGVTVRSTKIDLVEKLSRESTDLVSQGIPVESQPPQFYFTKMADIKREILGLAAEDARKRAEQIASKSGAAVGSVRGARMAPLQITPRYDFEIYSNGYNDLSSKEKAITAVVTMNFGLR